MRRLVIGLAVTSTTALAQPPALQTPPPPPVVQSILPNLFATTEGVTAELRFDYSDIDGIDLTIFNLFGHVQYLTPQGFGGYVRLPFGFVEDDDDTFDFGGSGIGNVEVGGLYVTKVGPATDLLARGGLSIDTTAEEDTLAVTLSTILPRMIDTYATSLQTTWARGQLQLRHAVDNLRFGGAIGFDMPVSGDAADDEVTGAISGVVSAGVQTGQLGLGASFVLLQPISDGEDENITGMNLGADWAVDPGVRLFTQLGFSLEDNSDGISIGVGTRATF